MKGMYGPREVPSEPYSLSDISVIQSASKRLWGNGYPFDSQNAVQNVHNVFSRTICGTVTSVKTPETAQYPSFSKKPRAAIRA